MPLLSDVMQEFELNISEKEDMYYIKITQSKEEPINLNEIQILEEESGLNVISKVVIIPSSFEPDPVSYNSSKLMSSYGSSRSNDSNDEPYEPLHFLKASFNTLENHVNIVIKNIEGTYDETSRIKGSKVELFDNNDNLIYTHPIGITIDETKQEETLTLYFVENIEPSAITKKYINIDRGSTNYIFYKFMLPHSPIQNNLINLKLDILKYYNYSSIQYDILTEKDYINGNYNNVK